MSKTYSSRHPMFTSTGDRQRRGSRRRRVETLGRSRAPGRLSGPAPIVLITAVIALLVACWVFGKGCITSQQALNADRLRTYTTSANGLLEHSASTAQAFSNLANGVGSVSKEEANKQLNEMKAACQAVEKEAVKVKVPENAANLQPLATLGFDLRTRGVEEYQAGIVALLGGGDGNAAIQVGLKDLVVSDEVLGNYRATLEKELKTVKATVPVTDPGKFVAALDSASSASVSAYVASITANVPGAAQPAGAENPKDAMAAYFKSKDVDTSAMSYEVVMSSGSNPDWKIDIASEPGEDPTYFLLHKVNGSWTVVQSGSSLTVEKMQAAGAPKDLKAVP